jgi:hypothetical protein
MDYHRLTFVVDPQPASLGPWKSCPMVFHSDGSPNFNLSAFLGMFSHAPMASPPISASSTDAKNDRGARPLPMGKRGGVFLKNKDEENSNSNQIQEQGKANRSSIQRW